MGHRQRATSSLNSGFDYPSKAVTIDLAPANMRNEGAHHSDEPDLGRGRMPADGECKRLKEKTDNMGETGT